MNPVFILLWCAYGFLLVGLARWARGRDNLLPGRVGAAVQAFAYVATYISAVALVGFGGLCRSGESRSVSGLARSNTRAASAPPAESLAASASAPTRQRSSLTRRRRGHADRRAGGRIVSVLEGGYDLRGLSASAAAHVATLMGFTLAESVRE